MTDIIVLPHDKHKASSLPFWRLVKGTGTLKNLVIRRNGMKICLREDVRTTNRRGILGLGKVHWRDDDVICLCDVQIIQSKDTGNWDKIKDVTSDLLSQNLAWVGLDMCIICANLPRGFWWLLGALVASTKVSNFSVFFSPEKKFIKWI